MKNSENSSPRSNSSTQAQKNTRSKKVSQNPHVGSSLDDLLEEDRILGEVNTIALKRVLQWQTLTK